MFISSVKKQSEVSVKERGKEKEANEHIINGRNNFNFVHFLLSVNYM